MSANTQHIGLFGGTFDPPHLGHLVMASAAGAQFGLGRIWWMPARRSPHKRQGQLSEARHRLGMTRAATEGDAAFRVSDMELRRSGPSFTVDTLRAMREAHPAARLFLLMGEDNWSQFHSWREPEAIRSMADLVVYPRRGGNSLPKSDLPARVVDAPLIDIAASGIRRRVREGRSIRYLVPDQVRAYIERNRLYVTAQQ